MVPPHLEFLAKHLRLAFYPKGEILIERRVPTQQLDGRYENIALCLHPRLYVFRWCAQDCRRGV
jgi:hypothetical protein